MSILRDVFSELKNNKRLRDPAIIRIVFEELLKAGEEEAGEREILLEKYIVLVREGVFGFDALNNIILQREARFDAWRETSSYNPEIELGTRYIYVAGLGLLRLAEIGNMKIDDDIVSLPQIARLPIQ